MSIDLLVASKIVILQKTILHFVPSRDQLKDKEPPEEELDSTQLLLLAESNSSIPE